MQLTYRMIFQVLVHTECVCIYETVRDLQSFGRCRWSLQFQGEHAGAEGQVVELQSFTENSEEECGFRQCVSGYLRLTAG